MSRKVTVTAHFVVRSDTARVLLATERDASRASCARPRSPLPELVSPPRVTELPDMRLLAGRR